MSPIQPPQSPTPEHPQDTPTHHENGSIQTPQNNEAVNPTQTPPSDEKKPQRTFLNYLLFFVNWVLIPLVIVFLFQAFIFQAFYVSGQSMEPTFQDGDYLIISKVGVTSKEVRSWFNKNATVNYQRGDVLVFRPPIATSTFYIKRLIALPGERIVIKNGVITIYNKDNPNGFVLHETYTDQAAVTLGDIDEVVDKDKVFVLGDNRTANGSYDSREWGQLPQSDITGRVILRLLPLNRLGLIHHVTYSLLQYPFRYIFKLTR